MLWWGTSADSLWIPVRCEFKPHSIVSFDQETSSWQMLQYRLVSGTDLSVISPSKWNWYKLNLRAVWYFCQIFKLLHLLVKTYKQANQYTQIHFLGFIYSSNLQGDCKCWQPRWCSFPYFPFPLFMLWTLPSSVYIMWFIREVSVHAS